MKSSRKYVQVISALAALLAAAALIGCGDSDEEATGESAISKAGFIRQADDICRATDNLQEAKIGVLGKKVAQTKKPMNDEELILAAGLPPLQQEAKELAELPLPADEGEAKAIVDGIKKAVKEVEKDPASLLGANTPFVGVQQQARAYGMQVCGSP